MIFSEKYEAGIVADILKIIRLSREIEHSKSQKEEETNCENNNISKQSLSELNEFSQHCKKVEAVRCIKNELENIAFKVCNDIDRITGDPLPVQRLLLPLQPLPNKQFTHCNSMLTDLLEVRHFRTIYNIFVVILMMMLLNTFVNDYLADGSINIGLAPIRLGLGKFHLALLLWMQLLAMSMLVFVMFVVWAKIRSLVIERKADPWTWSVCCIGLFTIYQLLMIGFTVSFVLANDLPIATSIATLMELTRFLMKNHAFVRSNAPKMWLMKPKSDGQPHSLPAISNFMYFLFAPTLVYRDAYPRTHHIRWKSVAWNVIEVAGVIFYVSFIFERFLYPYYKSFGDPNGTMTLQSLVVAIFGSVLPATLANLCGFYCLLHAWMNGWAELMRFGDRQFYKDWWNAASYDVYYRTWNIVVHDWLYTYVFKDVYEHVAIGSKKKATLAVFALSAVFHELILAVSFRFFYPVLFVMFLGAGMMLSFVRLDQSSSAGNVFFWFSMAFGNGLCISLYCMEFFARQNCPVDETLWSEYFVPVSWRCNFVL